MMNIHLDKEKREKFMNYTKEEIRKARSSDLYEYMSTNYKDMIIIVGNYIYPKWNKSISIKRGISGYYDFATGEHGNSIDFLTRQLEIPFMDAIKELLKYTKDDNKINNKIQDNINIKDDNIRIFTPPIKKKTNYIIKEYLKSRGIEEDIINRLYLKGMLYEDENNNCVFMNIERDYGEIKGTNKEYPFNKTITGSKSDGNWYLKYGNKKIAYICESAIDAISLYQIKREEGYYVSIGGVNKQKAIDRIITHMPAIIAVDNDIAGDLCAVKNRNIPRLLPKNKDWNMDLILDNSKTNTFE